MSAMGVIFLKRTFITSRQPGTYLSNRMVRLALSDWTSRVSIQLLTYLSEKHKRIIKTDIKLQYCDDNYGVQDGYHGNYDGNYDGNNGTLTAIN